MAELLIFLFASLTHTYARKNTLLSLNLCLYLPLPLPLSREGIIAELMKETDDVASRRKACKEMKELLQRALEILNEVRAYCGSSLILSYLGCFILEHQYSDQQFPICG